MRAKVLLAIALSIGAARLHADGPKPDATGTTPLFLAIRART